MTEYRKRTGKHLTLISEEGKHTVHDVSASADLADALRSGYLSHPNGHRYYLKPQQMTWLIEQQKELMP